MHDAFLFRYLVAAPAALLLTLGSLPARAQTEPQRTFGVGSGIGVGYAAASVSSTGLTAAAAGLALDLPTLELQFFLEKGYSIDVSLPITNIVVGSVALQGFFFNTDAFFNFNIGSGPVKLVVGPGLGFEVATARSVTLGALRVPGEVGVEILTAGRGFGFKVLARPFAEVAFGSGAQGFGGGALGMLVFSGYGTR